MKKLIFFIVLFVLIIPFVYGQDCNTECINRGYDSGVCRTGIGDGPTLLFKSDYEGVTKKDADELTLPIEHRMHGTGGGSDFWMDDGTVISGVSPTPHSGSRCVGMEAPTQAERLEFNIKNLEDLVTTDEFFIRHWLYLPVGWTVPSPKNWYVLNALYQADESPWTPMSEFGVDTHDGPDQCRYRYTYGTGPSKIWLNHDYGSLPVGEWFKLEWYVKLHETDGRQILWMNDELIGDDIKKTTNYAGADVLSTIAKIYGGEGSGQTYRLWVDDLEIWDGIPSSGEVCQLGEVPIETGCASGQTCCCYRPPVPTTTIPRRGGGCGRWCRLLGFSSDLELLSILAVIAIIILVAMFGLMKFFVKK